MRKPQGETPDHAAGAGRSPTRPRASRRLRRAAGLAVLLAMGAIVATPGTASAVAPVDLDDAASFAVLAGSAVTNTNLTTVTGDLGVSPGSSVSGFPPGTVVSGSIHANDATAVQAKADVVAAYNDISGRSVTTTVASQLGGTTVTPGVYDSADGTFAISGTLTLDAQSDPYDVFIFKATTLTAANVSNINLIGGAQADNVFWYVTDSASLGTFCTFRGNILAQSSATVGSGAAVFGRVFTVNNAITTTGTGSAPATRVTVPNDPPTTTALSASPNPSQSGQPVTFTATVTPVTGSLVPFGTVVFKDGTTIIGSDLHNQGGPAEITVSNLSPGEHPITAVYLGGDTPSNEGTVHFAPSTSPVVMQTVTSSVWQSTDTPAVSDHTGTDPVSLGLKFRASTSGTITGLRFYKGATNTGTHVGNLWTVGGSLLASATFTGETASGWQQVSFSTPVVVTAGTTYVASYHTVSGHFSYTLGGLSTQHTNGPLTALADGTDGGNGVYAYNATPTFPNGSYQATNYWADVVFVPSSSLWDASATPSVASHSDTTPIVVGTKFTPAGDGVVRGIRFYKGATNTGTHVGNLWTADGSLLASTTFTGESASGWQEANFSTPVAVTAGTTYVASYHTTSGHFSYTQGYFVEKYVNGPLTGLKDGDVGGNGVYAYNATPTFPSSTFNSTNYWVDVTFDLD
ncbi:DUF4082 domain-containing protein [Streptosporangium subroseum]|uniref:DUF4082 domain-containing protein n=1 Tax=Streptosporangium subroseum TaxID=106412 RepID=UPI00341EBC3A